MTQIAAKDQPECPAAAWDLCPVDAEALLTDFMALGLNEPYRILKSGITELLALRFEAFWPRSCAI